MCTFKRVLAVFVGTAVGTFESIPANVARIGESTMSTPQSRGAEQEFLTV